jgi:Predicted symporter
MSTADGLILAIANALYHDLYYKIIDPKAETAKRLVVARVLLVVIGLAGATIAANGNPRYLRFSNLGF